MPGHATSKQLITYPRILHITDNSGSECKESAVSQLMKKQAEMGAAPMLAIVGQNAPQTPPFDELAVKPVYTDKSQSWSFWRLLASIGKAIQSSGVDVLHAHDINSGFTAAIIGFRHRIPLVMTRHELHPDNGLPARIHRRVISRFCTRSVCATQQIMDQALTKDKTSSRKTLLIMDGVDLDESTNGNIGRTEARKSIGLNADDLVIMAISGFNSPDGSIEYLIRAVSQLTARHRNLKLVLAGDGQYCEYMKRLVKAFVLHRYVIFAGNSLDHTSLVNAADCYVPMSNKGRCLNNTLKAMACSLPVVCCTGNREISGVISDGDNGLVVGADDVDTLAEVLRRLINEPRLAISLGEAARQVVEKRFTWEQVHFQYLEVYRSVLRS